MLFSPEKLPFKVLSLFLFAAFFLAGILQARPASTSFHIEQAEKTKRFNELEEQNLFGRTLNENETTSGKTFRQQTIDNISLDDVEGEDLEVRRVAINALGNYAGTVVVMEAQTGKILTIINQNWAIRESFKPCSTIKLVTGIAGLNENLINKDGDVSARKHRLDLSDALAYSNNEYFQWVGENLGSDKMIYYAKMLGLGLPTGINAYGEAGGRLPFGNENPRIYSHADDFTVTPLQLAVMVSAISNGGKLVVPQIQQASFEQANFQGYMRRQVDLPRKNLTGVATGMKGAAKYGTARSGVDYSLGIAGKTGSCIENGSWVGLFASVAPIENPKYAVAVIMRGQNARGKYAAAISGKIYEFLAKRIKQNENVAALPLKIMTSMNLNQMFAKQDSDIDENTAISITDTSVIKIGNSRQSVEKEFMQTEKQKTVEELFPPIVITKNNSNGMTRPRVISDQ